MSLESSTSTRPASRAESDALPAETPLLVLVFAGEEVTRMVHLALSNGRYSLRQASTAAAALDVVRQRRPHVCLLDYGFVEADALGLCRRLRSETGFSSMAIIFLATRADEADRLLGFEAGADAYLAFPFGPRELVALIKAVVRSYQRRAEKECLRVGEIEIDTSAMLVTVAGRQLALSISEFRLLEFLCQNLGRALSRDQLVRVVSKNVRVGKRAVDVYIRRLRQKIERDPAEPRYLKTMRGVGYRLDAGSKG